MKIPNTQIHVYAPWQQQRAASRWPLPTANAGPATGTAPALPQGAAAPQPRRILGFAFGPVPRQPASAPQPNLPTNVTATLPALPAFGVQTNQTPAPVVAAPTAVAQGTQTPPPPMTNADTQTPTQATSSTSTQTTGPVMVDASTQTLPHATRLVPDTVLSNIMDHVVANHDQNPRRGRRERFAVANMMQLDRASHRLLREQADTVRLSHLTGCSYGSINRVRTAAQVQTLLHGSAETFGHVTRLQPDHRERPLVNLLRRLSEMQDVERHAATPLVLNAIAALPPQNAANVLAQAVPHVTDAVLNTIVGAPNIPGTILNLPPTLQPQPLDAVVTRAWTYCMPGNPERINVANMVNALPAGVGDLVKARVQNP